MGDDRLDVALVDEVLAAHLASGRRFSAGGLSSFVLDQGVGEPVVLMHGLPVSSFLYRKVVPALAARGYRAICFDLPGLGLADRPRLFDYSIAGLGRFAVAAVDALGLERFHLVVHDAGGPVGFELAAADPGRILSLTVLDTVIGLEPMPFPGELYARFSDRLRGAMTSPRLFRELMWRVGIEDRAAVPLEQVDAHRRLLLDPDHGSAYLQIMRTVRDVDPRRWTPVVDTRSVPYPVDVVWGAKDPILPMRRHGWRMTAAAHLPWLTALPAKHYLQEDRSDEVAALVARNAARSRTATHTEEYR